MGAAHFEPDNDEEWIEGLMAMGMDVLTRSSLIDQPAKWQSRHNICDLAVQED
jgi:hypothetical protein